MITLQHSCVLYSPQHWVFGISFIRNFFLPTSKSLRKKSPRSEEERFTTPSNCLVVSSSNRAKCMQGRREGLMLILRLFFEPRLLPSLGPPATLRKSPQNIRHKSSARERFPDLSLVHQKYQNVRGKLFGGETFSYSAGER